MPEDKPLAETPVETTTPPTTPESEAAPAGEPPVEEKADAEAQPEAAEPESDDEEESEPSKEKKLPGSQRYKRRLQQIASEYSALLERNAELERRVANPSEGKPGVERAPTEADFPNDYLAYDRARQSWDMRQVFREEKAATERREHAATAAALIAERRDAYDESLPTVRERIPDFDKVIAKAKDIPVTEMLVNEIGGSEKAALLQYHLAQNPDVVRELNSLTGVELARAVARLEGKVHLPKPEKATKAAPPPTQVKGQAARTLDINDPKISMEDYIRLRREQEKRP